MKIERRARMRARRAALAAIEWREIAPGVRARVYASEKAYREHQESKLATLDPRRMAEYDMELRHVLAIRLPGALRCWGLPYGEARVLCLGARTGAEVQAFRLCGVHSAIGVDLRPAGPGVVEGDFHSLGFADGSFHIVYTNSLDHARDIRQVLAEVRRVLKPGGLFIVEASSKPPGEYESLAWDSMDSLLDLIEANHFRAVAREAREFIAFPWKGERFLLFAE